MPEDGIDEGAPAFGTGGETIQEQIAAANEQERLNAESAAREAAAQKEYDDAAALAEAQAAADAQAAAEAEAAVQEPVDEPQPEPDVEEPAPGSTAAEGLPSLAPSADDYKRWQEQGFVGESDG